MTESRYSKGDVVMVDVPYLDGTRTVRRPAVIVSDCHQMLDVIIAAVTSRIREPLPTTHYVIDQAHNDWHLSGLRLDSAVRCDRLFTVHGGQIHRTLGRLSTPTIDSINECLRKAFGLD